MTSFKTVLISQGSLRGKLVSSKYGYDYCSFQGIPYAEPPLGCLRFKPPQPPASWQGTRDALQEGNRAPHFDMVTKLFTGNEDCLFLNVYTRKTDYTCAGELKPVMVFIHGGGFAFGHADADVYGPDFLIQHDVILVTLNYRLGVLGFLNLECPEAPGNVGLKDQVAALKWVQKEIHHFGGDANNVTIFGQSAGGASVHLHMLSDMSRGLFHKAIAQSGNALCNWAFTSCHKRRAFNLAHLLGFNAHNTSELLQFLHNVPPIKFAEIQDSAICSNSQTAIPLDCLKCSEDFLAVEGIDQAFVPSVEKNTEGEAFISDSPYNLMKSGKMNDVPFINGVTAHEGVSMLNSVVKHHWFLAKLIEKLNDMVPDGFYKSAEGKNKTALEMKNLYFKNDLHSLEADLEGIVNFYTDYNYVLPMARVIKLFKDTCTSPLYCYQFSYDGAFGWEKRLMAKHRKMTAVPKGVCHGDDLGYLFTNTVVREQNTDSSSDEMTVVRNFTTLLTNFAKTGNPNCVGCTVNWTPTPKDQIMVLSIDVDLKAVQPLEKERLDFWSKVLL